MQGGEFRRWRRRAVLWGCCMMLALQVSAQKYACVNTDYVLRSVPEYAAAQAKLDRMVEEWGKEIDDKNAELATLRAEYEQENYLLPDNLKKRRQEDIKNKEQEIRELQQQRFGVGGDMDKRRAEVMRPVQERVYSAIEKIARDKGYAFVFDRAGSSTVLFVSKKYDISDEVLESMGYKPGAAAVDPQANTADSRAQGKKGKAASNPEMRQPTDRSGKNTPLGGTDKR